MKEKDKEKNKLVVKIEKWDKYKKYIIHILIMFVELLLLLCSMISFETVVTFIYIIVNNQFIIITLLIWIGLYLIFKGITNRTKLSILLVISFEAIFDIINYFIRTIRSSAITISDLYSIKTALSVANNVSIEIDKKFIMGCMYLIGIICIMVTCGKSLISKKDDIKERILKLCIGVILIVSISKLNIIKECSIWSTNDAYEMYGTPVTIIRMLQDFKVKPPKNYNKNETANLLKEYENKENNNLTEDKPNIIVIVNESYSDYYNLYKDGLADPIEYFTELSKSENVISGTMYSSTFGGGTSNVEYEFLTQNSIRILPVGATVFQQYLSKPIKSSIVSNLKQQGYTTSAMHTWESYAYSRNKVYKLFGFDSIKFKDDIDGLERNFNSEFSSDRSTYKQLIKEINEKNKYEKVFKYVLTVQNHLQYYHRDRKQMIYNQDMAKNVYMQLIHESTDALKEVIEELKQKDEKYILLFFGDHQPKINGNTLDDVLYDKYKVPFLIWANYDIDEQYNIETSTIFLQNYLLKAAGLEFSDMNNYMEEMKEVYPVITNNFYIDTEGNIYDKDEEDSEKIKEYNKIDYYRIFDNK